MSLGLLRLLDDHKVETANPPQSTIVSASVSAAGVARRIRTLAVSSSAVTVPDTTKHQQSSLSLHPRYELFLRRYGYADAERLYSLGGVIVSGHPDRHVVQAELDTGTTSRFVYVKKELTRGIRIHARNWWEGHGWLNRCEREARLLARLEAAKLPCPQWLAYGRNHAGRGFLVLDAFASAVPLSRCFHEFSQRERLIVAENLGRLIARYHLAGFTTPELCWKHLFIDPNALDLVLIDWQSAEARRPTEREASDAWASLAASVPANIPRKIQLLAWQAYRGAVQIELPLRELACLIKQKKRRRLKDQQHLEKLPIWRQYEGEACCVEQTQATLLGTAWNVHNFYKPSETTDRGTSNYRFEDGSTGQLNYFRSRSLLPRVYAIVKEKPWRSPATRAARVLLRCEQFQIPAPRVVAFGQRSPHLLLVESFLLTNQKPEGTPFLDAWRQADASSRRSILRALGVLSRRLQQAGLGFTESTEHYLVWNSQQTIQLTSSGAVQLQKRSSIKKISVQLAALLTRMTFTSKRLSYTECCLVAHHFETEVENTASRKRTLRLLIQLYRGSAGK